MLDTILFDTRTGIWLKTTPEELVLCGSRRDLMRFMATDRVLIAARVNRDLSTIWLLNAWERLNVPKHPGKVSIGKLTKESLRTSGLLLDEGDPIVIAWELPVTKVRPSDRYLDECKKALGVTREEESARSFLRY